MNDFVSLCEFVGIPRVLVQGMSNKVKDIYILRRTKKDLDMNDIPECHFENVELEMYREERRLYEYVFEDAQETVREIFKTTTNISAKTWNSWSVFFGRGSVASGRRCTTMVSLKD